MTDFTISTLSTTVTEGGAYEFTITPTAALLADATIRWVIVQKGALPVAASDFSSLSGEVTFTSGATAAQTVTITPADDVQREVSKDFELRIYDGGSLLATQAVTLEDDDTRVHGNEFFTGDADTNIIGLGTTHEVTANGGAGNDVYIITRFQYGVATITDGVGSANLIKFDAGVTITGYSEDITEGFFSTIDRAILTLSTGAEVRIENPASRFTFQLGAGDVLETYADFKAAIGVAEGADNISTPFAVTTYTDVPDISDNSLSPQFLWSHGSALADVFSAASSYNVRQNGGAGDDIFVITRFQYGSVEIRDGIGKNNLIKFDAGVTITGYSEDITEGLFNTRTINRAVLTLSTGAEITINNPVGGFDFQLGDGEIIDSYAEFKEAIEATGSNEASSLAAHFNVPFLVFAAASTEDETLAVNSLENQLTVATLKASGATATISLTWSLEGADADLFAIDSTTGAITWVSTPDFETTVSVADSNVFSVTARGTADSGATDSVALTITLTDENEAPVIHPEVVTLSAPIEATEGEAYEFDITPSVALSDGVTIRWEIVPKGAVPVVSSDFSALTGSLDFAAGETDAQTVTITPTDDARLETSKDFELRLYDGDRLLDTQAVTLSDNDAGTFGEQFLAGNADANLFGLGTAYDVIRDGGLGDDVYVITRFQHGNVRIDDSRSVSGNLLKFDAGVTITDFAETTAGFGFLLTTSNLVLTLSTGATITLTGPTLGFRFQLGDGDVFETYAEFKAAIGATGTNAASALKDDEPFAVTSYTNVPENILSAQSTSFSGTAAGDVFTAASSYNLVQDGGGGDDIYVITRFQYGTVEITDTIGTDDLIKFDAGVSIKGFAETITRNQFFERTDDFVLTLSTDATITINAPTRFKYQIGDGEILETYAEFKAAIKTSAEGVENPIDTPFTVPFLDFTPASTQGKTLAVNSDENQLAVATLRASDVDTSDTLTWTLTSGADVDLFAIDSTTGAITWVDAPDFETIKSAANSKEFSVTATATDSTGATDSIVLTITLTDANDAPVIHTEAVALSAEATATEGVAYSFDITPTALLSAATTIRWEIAQKGALPVASSDFSTFTGTLDFTAGATAAQTVTITPTDDARLETSKDFELRLYDGTDLLATQAVTLKDNDEGTFGSERFTGNAEANIIGLGTSHNVRADGGASDDFYVITRFQHGNVRIADSHGINNLIKFDAGVTISDFQENTSEGFFGKTFDNIILTLSTGAKITIVGPTTFHYQLGAGEVIAGDGTAGSAYAAFKTAIGVVEGEDNISTPFAITTYTDVPDISDNSLSPQLSRSYGNADANVFSSASTYNLRQDGGAGDDTYVITRFQHGDVRIEDSVSANNLIKLDAGVSITGFSETTVLTPFGLRTNDFILTLSTESETEAKITIIGPARFKYQIGDGEIIAGDGTAGSAYAEFKATIGATGTNEASSLAEDFTVPFLDFSTQGKTLAVSSDENQDVVTTLAVVDEDGDDITWSLSGADEGFFEVLGGAITWKGTPDFETAKSAAHDSDSVFSLTATATDAAGATDSINLTVTLADVNEAPVITQGDALAVRSAENQDAVTTLSATDDDGDVLTWSLVGTSSLFTIGSTTGAITWKTAPDYETLNSRFGDKIFALTARVTDGEEQAFIAVRVMLEDVNEKPVIFHDGTAVADDVTIAVNSLENQLSVITLTASDADGDSLTWKLDGDDEHLFIIDDGGEIKWGVTPDFDTTVSMDAVNTKMFDLTATVTDDGGLLDTIELTITLVDVM